MTGQEYRLERDSMGEVNALNVMMPIMGLRLLEAIEFTAAVVKAFAAKCVVGIEANE